MTRKVLFLVPYPLQESPSQRFRFEQYFQLLEKHGIQFSVQSFLDSHNWQIFFKSGHIPSKIFALLAGFTKRLVALLKAPFYHFIFIHREMTPAGPPLFEWILAKILKKKIIYDFDDAIWLPDGAPESRLVNFLKWRNKVTSICKWSYKISCGNEYLSSYARKYNTHVLYNPTTIDTLRHNPDNHQKSPNRHIVIGWTGSHSTLKYLTELESVLQRLESQFPMVIFMVIANRKPDLKLNTLHYVPWKKKNEIPDLLLMDIGIMPLPNDEWTKGKCGFKALQYMALEIPVVASAVGTNSKIIDDGDNGFLCTSSEEWGNALTKLIQDETLRKYMGKQGRKKVIERYSVTSNSSNFLLLFE